MYEVMNRWPPGMRAIFVPIKVVIALVPVDWVLVKFGLFHSRLTVFPVVVQILGSVD